MIGLDASAALSGLLTDGSAREWMIREQLHAPHLIDSGVVTALRRRVAAGRLTAGEGWQALDTWRRLDVRGMSLLPSCWDVNSLPRTIG